MAVALMSRQVRFAQEPKTKQHHFSKSFRPFQKQIANPDIFSIFRDLQQLYGK